MGRKQSWLTQSWEGATHQTLDSEPGEVKPHKWNAVCKLRGSGVSGLKQKQESLLPGLSLREEGRARVLILESQLFSTNFCGRLALVLGALVPEVTPSLGTAKAMGLSERRRLSGPLCTGGPGAERAGLLSLPVRPASVEENSTADIHVCTTLLHSEAVTHQTLQNNICERRWIWLAVP